MKLTASLLLATSAVAIAVTASAETIAVTEATEGALMEALATAAQSTETTTLTLEFDGAATIESTLIYDGRAPLQIIGNGATISTAANVTLLEMPMGASLALENLTLRGPGGFSIENRGDLDGVTGGKGIFIGVPIDQTQNVSVVLNNVTIADVANHGLHVSDCSLADDCGGGQGGGGDGSPASIFVSLSNTTIDNAGNGRFDADGLRVDERGAGSIDVVLTDSLFTNVGADGVEMDEGNEGDVNVTSLNSRFIANGNYCDPAVLSAFLPDPDEAEFDQPGTAESAIPAAVTGSPDDRCIEREVDLFDDGTVEAYEFGLDLDDGFDIDEDGEGSLRLVMVGGVIEGNLDEGLDLDEAGDGNIEMHLSGTTASGNTDDAYKLSEEDGGSVIANVIGASAAANGGKGFVFEEEGDGDVFVTVTGTAAAGNDDSDETGIEAVQEDDGKGVLIVFVSDIADGFDLDGVEEH